MLKPQRQREIASKMTRWTRSRVVWATAILLLCGGVALCLMSRPKQYRATVALEVELSEMIDVAASDPAIRYCGPDMNTYLHALESRMLAAQVMASYTENETNQLIATSKQGSPLGEVSFEPRNSKPAQIIISATHQNPVAAVIIANRYAGEFQRFMRSTERNEREEIVKDLKRYAAQIEEQVRAAETVVDEAKSSNDRSNLQKAEKALARVREPLLKINQRIKETEAPPSSDLPIRILSMAEKAEKVDWWRY